MGKAEGNKSCFIITPIGNPKSEIHRKISGVIASVIRPVLKEKCFSDIKAAHEICEIGSINTQIINRIIDSDLVIANLTGNNPNVMYELCLRHVVAKPIIHICEVGTNLPFDIKDNRTIFYSDDMLGAAELKEKLIEFVDSIDYKNEYKDNPIYNAQQVGNLLKSVPKEDEALEIQLLQNILNKLDYMGNEKFQVRYPVYNKRNSFANEIILLINNYDEVANLEVGDLFKEELSKRGVYYVDDYADGKWLLRVESAIPYYKIESTIRRFAEKYNLDIQILFRSGEK